MNGFSSPSTRSKKYLTALASKAVPSWKRTPLRSLKVQVRPSFDDVHDSASAGSSCILVLNRTRLSYIIRFTCSPGFDCVFCGSRLSGSAPAAKLSVPPATGVWASTDQIPARPPVASTPTTQSATIRRIVPLLSGRVTGQAARRICRKPTRVKSLALIP